MRITTFKCKKIMSFIDDYKRTHKKTPKRKESQQKKTRDGGTTSNIISNYYFDTVHS